MPSRATRSSLLGQSMRAIGLVLSGCIMEMLVSFLIASISFFWKSFWGPRHGNIMRLVIYTTADADDGQIGTQWLL